MNRNPPSSSTKWEKKQKGLFLNAKMKIADLIRKEDINGVKTQMMVWEGLPFVEINKKAIENGAELIIVGSK